MIDESLMISDPDLRSRFFDRIEDELLQRSEEAKAYLSESGIQSISQSSLLRVLRFVPGLKGPIDNAQGLAESLRTSRTFEAEPLAYLAFARTAFVPVQNYIVDPNTGMPLVQAMRQTIDETS